MDRKDRVEAAQPSGGRQALLTRLHDLLSVVAALKEAARRSRERSHRRTAAAAAGGDRHLAAFHDRLAGKLQLAVYGTHSGDWMRALVPSAAVWSSIDLLGHVVHVPAGEADAKARLRPDLYPVFLPLMEGHTRALPAHAASLTPAPELIDLLENKDLFGVYLEELGLAAHAPRHFWSIDEVEYPCVFKPVGLNGGQGVAVISDEEELRAAIAGHVVDEGRYLLQSLTVGADEFVTHALLRDGKVIWDTTFLYLLGGTAVVRTAVVTGDCAVRRAPTARAVLDLLDWIGADLGFSGPVNVDYKIIDGKPIIFEINPRLGGSLMRPENADLLGEALRRIVHSAASSEAFFAEIIRGSKLFDPDFYMGKGHEFEPRPEDPAAHYLRSGCAEGRDPSEAFSTSDYIDLHFDRSMAGLNPLVHYELLGRFERRPVRRRDRATVKAACSTPAAHPKGDFGKLVRRLLPASVARRVTTHEGSLVEQVGKAIAGLLH